MSNTVCGFLDRINSPTPYRRTSVVLTPLWPGKFVPDMSSSSHGRLIIIKKTCLYNFDPLKPHFYIVKLGFTGVYIIFLISAQKIDCGYSLEPPRPQKIDCGYSLEPPRRGGSNEYPQSMFWAEIWKNIRIFYLKIFSFWRWNFLYIWIGVSS